jgi:paraquat-inducible protein B
VALSRPPLTPADAPGIRVLLLSDEAASITTGDAVLYKGYKVGRVESSLFDTGINRMRYTLFIDAPFHELVDTSTRFWNTSGISLSASAEGLELHTGSLDTVLLGGVAFGRPPDVPPGNPVEPETEFELYPSYEASRQNPFSYGTYFVVRFAQSLKGLLPGAPVEYRGIRVGRVERILLQEMMQANLQKQVAAGQLASRGEPIPVLIYLEPGRLALPDAPASLEVLTQAIANGVESGMRATLETGNLLTGAKYVGIDFYPDVTDQAEVGQWGDYTTIPTIGGGVEQIMVKVNSILEKIDRAPIDETLTSVNDAVAKLDKALIGLDKILGSEATQQLPEDINRTLDELRQTLDGLSPDSELYQNINASMGQLNRTLNNLETLTRTLSGQPNAVIMGSRLPPDPQPEARR